MGLYGAMEYFLFVVFLISFCHAEPFRVCTREGFKNDCEQLQREGTVNCVVDLHSVDCLFNIQDGRSDFGRISAEEAVLGAKFINDVNVIGEFRSSQEDSAYATVVLVRSNNTGNFRDLRGNKFCHPGFKHENTISELLLKEFENDVIQKNNATKCENIKNTATTMLEKELNSLSNFFGSSCRPGPWIDFDDLNSKFYTEYSTLCELCPNKDCSVQSSTPFQQSLKCLVENGGDVAVTTLHTVADYFSKPDNIRSRTEFSFLCRDGQLSGIGTPCVWSKQPWDLIVAQKDKAVAITSALKNIFANYVSDTTDSMNLQTISDFLGPLFLPKDFKNIKFLSDSTSLADYITGLRPIIQKNDSIKCGETVKWCTTSNGEQEKCNWLAQASANHAIQPIMECSQQQDQFTCIDDIKAKTVDVITSDAHFGYIVRLKNLEPLAYPETPSSVIKTIVVVKEDSIIHSFKDLKDKKACFPEYGGIEWLSFINTARSHKAFDKDTCEYTEALSNFVGDSCIPGSNDVEHTDLPKLDYDKLCKLCEPVKNFKTTHFICSADNNNSFYGNEGALECLRKDGDFAVVMLKEYSNINASDFRVLCKNGSLALHSGLNVDNDCTLLEIVNSEVVSKKDNPKNDDIKVLLLNFERKFGLKRVKEFEVFNPFHNGSDYLFKDSTAGLNQVNATNKYIQNYQKAFAKCVVDPNNSTAAVKVSMLYILCFVLVLYRF